MFKRLRMATGFLTVLPVGGAAEAGEEDLARSVGAFTLVGLLEGVVLTVAYLAAGAVLPPLPAAAVAVLCYLALTGGLHLDGLADTCDGFGARGGMERRLAAMKDPATGPMGAAAVAMSLMLKVFAVAALGERGTAAHYGALVMTPAMGKWCMVGLLRAGRAARPGGLGRLFAGRIGGAEIAGGAIPLILAYAALAALGPQGGGRAMLAFGAGAAVAAYALGAALARLCGLAFGGVTGDTAGASGEAAEVLYMLLVIAWLRPSI